MWAKCKVISGMRKFSSPARARVCVRVCARERGGINEWRVSVWQTTWESRLSMVRQATFAHFQPFRICWSSLLSLVPATTLPPVPRFFRSSLWLVSRYAFERRARIHWIHRCCCRYYGFLLSVEHTQPSWNSLQMLPPTDRHSRSIREELTAATPELRVPVTSVVICPDEINKSTCVTQVV